jgi:putative ABC transport system ATP-binding protein
MFESASHAHASEHPPAASGDFLRLENVSRLFHLEERIVVALKEVTLSIRQGEVLIVLGPSGSGKTTMLNLIGGIDRATHGRLWHAGKDLAQADRNELARYRRESVGFVFQFYNLIPDLTAAENVDVAAELCQSPHPTLDVLDQVGLTDRKDHFPAQLSGGEQQRVAIARALVKNPDALLCDEPTGALDFETGKQVLRLLVDLSRQLGKTVIIVTHNAAISPIGDRVVRMRSGEIAHLQMNPNPVDPGDISW